MAKPSNPRITHNHPHVSALMVPKQVDGNHLTEPKPSARGASLIPPLPLNPHPVHQPFPVNPSSTLPRIGKWTNTSIHAKDIQLYYYHEMILTHNLIVTTYNNVYKLFLYPLSFDGSSLRAAMFMTASTEDSAAAAASGTSSSLDPQPRSEWEGSCLRLVAPDNRTESDKRTLNQRTVMLSENNTIDCEKKTSGTLCVTILRTSIPVRLQYSTPYYYLITYNTINKHNKSTQKYTNTYVDMFHQVVLCCIFSIKYDKLRGEIVATEGNALRRYIHLVISLDRLSRCDGSEFPEISLWASISAEYSFTMSIYFLYYLDGNAL